MSSTASGAQWVRVDLGASYTLSNVKVTWPATYYARRFQIQEDLVKEIAEEVMTSGHARAVRVISDGRHLCMCSRGPSDPNAFTRTEFEAGSWHS